MKKIISTIFFIISLILASNICFAATILKDKEDAKELSKKSIYSEVGVSEQLVTENTKRDNDDAINKFSVTTATKNGNTYTNTWSNYTITFEDNFNTANEFYDFYADGIKYDFGIYFSDYSRIAVYYTRLAKDINVVAANFAPGKTPVDEVVAGEVYKHVSLEVPYPFGVEKYDYYLRNIDGKLMVIEVFYEKDDDKSKQYIEEFTKVS